VELDADDDGRAAAVAAKLELPLSAVDCVAPDVGGGFGVKIMHPWPEEVLVPWAARRLGAEVKWTEDRASTSCSSAHERAQLQHVRVGFDDDGRLLGLDVRFWHDNGAYLPYGVIVPIITSTQLLGPYKPGAYRVEFDSLYTTTVIVTPVPRRRPAAGRLRDGADDGRHRRPPRASTASRCARRTSSSRRDAVRPADDRSRTGVRWCTTRATSRPRWTSSRRSSAGRDFAAYRAQARAEGGAVGIGIACYVEGTGVGPYEGGHVQVETSGKVVVATGLTTQGQGHETVFAQIVADELGVAFEDVTVTTGDTRRMPYSVGTFASRAAVMSGNAVGLAARNVKQKALRIAADALEADPGDLEIVDGQVRVRGNPSVGLPLSTVAVLSNPLRYAFDKASQAATSSSSATPTRRRSTRTTSPASRDATSTRRRSRRSPTACTRSSSRPTPRPPRSASCATASCTTAATSSTR
jgi:CO/xanthine dehydrogenase Mo-binding subunit